MKEIEIFDDEGPVDISIIEKFEKQIGYSLPVSYKELLSKHNALYPEEGSFDFVFKEKSNTHSFVFLGYGDEVESYEQISRSQQTEYCYEHIVVFGETPNGDYICFDYRADPTTNNPPVVVMLHDYPDENDMMMVCPVADNFEAFIDSLYKWEDDE